MVLVSGRYCVDRFEISLEDQASGASLSPHYPVRTEYAGFLRIRKSEAKKLGKTFDAGEVGATPFPELSKLQMGGKFVAKAVSKKGVLPNGFLSRNTARAACEVAGKRLCTRSEWRMACKGELGTKYPYGRKYERVQCNLGRGKHPARILFGKPSASVIDPRLNLMQLDGAPLLRKTGDTPTCKSSWGSDAIYDMVGNLDEWVDDDRGIFLGAAYTRYTKAGCSAAIDAHPAGYWDYSTGARCCQDAKGAETPTPDAAAAKEFERRATRMIRDEQAAAARGLVREALRSSPRDATLNKLYDKTLVRDPGFAMQPRDIDLSSGVDAIKYLGGGSTVTMRFIEDEKVTAAFKPEQTDGASDYQSEIAAWRLCEILRCDFYVPRNEPVRLEKSVFETLYSRISSDKQRTYRRRHFFKLVWRKDAGKEYLLGALEDWVKHLVELPVEHVHVWQPWLSQPAAGGVALSSLERPAIDAFSVKDARNSEAHRRNMRKQFRDMTQLQLARLLSQLFVFDYLIGNWDRMSTKPAYYGSNCHIADGRIVSIDNAAAFRDGVHPKLEKRFEPIQRFSAAFIMQIRDLNRDRTLRRLFPDADAEQKTRFAVFWKQRERLLARVAQLEKKHGSLAVLSFD